MPHWRSSTSLAAAELSQSLLDASRVAVDNLVQAEDRRTAGGRGRQREPWGTFLWGTAEENKESAPVFTNCYGFLYNSLPPLHLQPVLCAKIQVFLITFLAAPRTS